MYSVKSEARRCSPERPDRRVQLKPPFKNLAPALLAKSLNTHVRPALLLAAVSALSICTATNAAESWQRIDPSGVVMITPVQLENGWRNIQFQGGAGSADSVHQSDVNQTSRQAADLVDTQSPAVSGADPLPTTSQLIEFDNAHSRSVVSSSQADVVSGQLIQLSTPSVGNTINLDLFVGQVSVLGQVDVNRVAVGNGDIIRVQVLDTGELLVIAAAQGSSSLRLWHKDKTQTDYNIRVAATDPETRVPLERMVRMRVRMVEFRKSALGRLGIDWNDSASGPVLATAGEAAGNQFLRPTVAGVGTLSGYSSPMSAYLGMASSITSKINLLAQSGDAVTLAEPILSAMNGGQASFLAGGEVPYPSVGENGQMQVEFKEYGVKLNVAPLIDSAGNVRAMLETEISQLDSSVSVQGTPGLLTRRAQTEVTVRSGQTIVISGLLSSEGSTDNDRVPGLGKLPFLGRLFSSSSRRNAVSELVIFVTPEVIEPGHPMINARERLYLDASERRADKLRQQLPLME